MKEGSMSSISPRKSLRFVFALLFVGLMAVASSGIVLAQGSSQPPLIDRELFFGDPEISGAQISPDGKFIAFIKPLKGTRNIWVKRTEDPFDTAKPITADTKRPIPGFFWSRDGKYILFVQDQQRLHRRYAAIPQRDQMTTTPLPFFCH